MNQQSSLLGIYFLMPDGYAQSFWEIQENTLNRKKQWYNSWLFIFVYSFSPVIYLKLLKRVLSITLSFFSLTLEASIRLCRSRLLLGETKLDRQSISWILSIHPSITLPTTTLPTLNTPTSVPYLSKIDLYIAEKSVV